MRQSILRPLPFLARKRMPDVSAQTSESSGRRPGTGIRVGRNSNCIISSDESTTGQSIWITIVSCVQTVPICSGLFRVRVRAFDEGRCFNRTGAMDRGFQDYGCPRLRKHWNECYFNSGVMVVSRRHRQLFAEPAVRHDNFIEQTFLNVGLVHHHLNVYDIGHEFNFMTSIVPLTGLPVEAGYIAHLAGILQPPRGYCRVHLANWERAEPHYQFRKHIWLDVGGDWRCYDAEPVALPEGQDIS